MNIKSSDSRKYIRHPTTVPITVSSAEESEVNLQTLNNIGTGGLSFLSESPWKKGATIRISFHAPYNFSHELLKVFGRVVWCKEAGTQFEVGVEFLRPMGSAVDIVHLVEEMYRRIEL